MIDTAPTLIKSDLPEKWQQILADLITDPKELLDILQLDLAACPADASGLEQFPLKVPRPFVKRMEKGNWYDPLLRQVWPFSDESIHSPDLNTDPLRESGFVRAPGLMQKYRGRVLLTAAPHCAIHCRYCFRRHFDYAANSPGRLAWQQSLVLLRRDESINEAILSGGDPLANSDRQLDWLIGELEAIPHLHTLRIHSRLPVVIPERLSPGLRQRLSRSRLRVVLVIHANHGAELDLQVSEALSGFAAEGLTLLNQSVLLKDVNDNIPALEGLSRRLFDAHVLPYYLHLPDPVAGTAHYQVSTEIARDLVRDLRARLPGYLVPRLVREIPGEAAKTPL